MTENSKVIQIHIGSFVFVFSKMGPFCLGLMAEAPYDGSIQRKGFIGFISVSLNPKGVIDSQRIGFGERVAGDEWIG